MGDKTGDREPASWMRIPIDHQLLEYLSEEEPVQLTETGTITEASEHEARNRFQILSGYGLVEKEGASLSLTESGQAYLAGDMDVANLEQQ
jgi:predicted transcriptional regulator